MKHEQDPICAPGRMANTIWMRVKEEGGRGVYVADHRLKNICYVFWPIF